MIEPLDKSSSLPYESNYNLDLNSIYVIYNPYLQDLAQKISYISALESKGKISSDQANRQIYSLWEEFKRTKMELKADPNG